MNDQTSLIWQVRMALVHLLLGTLFLIECFDEVDSVRVDVVVGNLATGARGIKAVDDGLGYFFGEYDLSVFEHATPFPIL